MGLFERFPYTNFHELNAEWLLKKMKELAETVEQFIATESLKFADPIMWDITTQYQKSTIVVDPTGNAYLSIQPVPAGVQLNDEEYWLEIFNFTDYTRTANKNLTVNVETNTTRATSPYNVDDWLIWEDVLYRVTAAIAIDDTLIVAPDDGSNIVHFTVEDFIKAWITYANGIIQQYKNDIDASELAYRNQLALDIANTTASLQAQLNAAISGATVDSEIINARVSWFNETFSTLKDALDTEYVGLFNIIKDSLDSQTIVEMISNASINGSGQLTTGAFDIWFASVEGGAEVIVNGGDVYAFYTTYPEIGDTALDNTRYVTSGMHNYAITIPATCNILAIRSTTRPLVISPTGKLSLFTYVEEYKDDFDDARINSIGVRTSNGATVATNHVPYDGFVGSIITSGIRGLNYFKSQIAIGGGNQYDFYIRQYYVSWSAWKRVLLEDDAYDAPLDILGAFTNIDCCGDSLTKSQVYTGAGTSRTAYRPYPDILASLTGATVTTFAQGGYTPVNWWNAWENSIVAKTNQLAIIYLGTNGGLTDTLATDAPPTDPYSDWANTNTGCYAKIVAKYKSVGARILLVKVYDGTDVATTNNVIEQVAARFQCSVVDNPYLADSKYHFYPDLSGENATHYNDLGYAAFTKQLINNTAKLATHNMKYIIPA